MPAYGSNPNVTRFGIVLGSTAYLVGSRNQSVGPAKFYVTAAARATNVATLTLVYREGNLPATGNLVWVTGVQVDAAFNVSGVALASVTLDPTTGNGTITFASTGVDTPTTPTGGQAIVAAPEVGEALTNQTYRQIGVPESSQGNQNQLAVTWSVFYPSAPATVTMTLQAAEVDQDAQYQDLDSTTVTTVDQRVITSVRFQFFRAKASNVTGGTNPTAVVRVNI